MFKGRGTGSGERGTFAWREAAVGHSASTTPKKALRDANDGLAALPHVPRSPLPVPRRQHP